MVAWPRKAKKAENVAIHSSFSCLVLARARFFHVRAQALHSFWFSRNMQKLDINKWSTWPFSLVLQSHCFRFKFLKFFIAFFKEKLLDLKGSLELSRTGMKRDFCSDLFCSCYLRNARIGAPFTFSLPFDFDRACRN